MRKPIRIPSNRTGALPSFKEGEKTLKARDLQSLSDGVRAGTLGVFKGGNGIISRQTSSGVNLGLNASFIKSITRKGYDDMLPFEIRWHKSDLFVFKGGFATMSNCQHMYGVDTQGQNYIDQGSPYTAWLYAGDSEANVLQKEQFSTYIWGPGLWPDEVVREGATNISGLEASNFDNCYIRLPRTSDWIVHVGNVTPANKFPIGTPSYPNGSWGYPVLSITPMSNGKDEMLPRNGFTKPMIALVNQGSPSDADPETTIGRDIPRFRWVRPTYTGVTVAVIKREGTDKWKVLQNATGSLSIPNDPAIQWGAHSPLDANEIYPFYLTRPPEKDDYYFRAYNALQGHAPVQGLKQARRNPRITSSPDGDIFT